VQPRQPSLDNPSRVLTLTKCTNQTLETYLHAYCSYQQDNWVDYLPFTKFSFNNAKNSLTKVSPFYTLTDHHLVFEPCLMDNANVPAPSDLTNHLQHIHSELKAELQYVQETQAVAYN
jgi:hypothetical protein